VELKVEPVALLLANGAAIPLELLCKAVTVAVKVMAAEAEAAILVEVLRTLALIWAAVAADQDFFQLLFLVVA
jgi:hypothetical protein